MAYAYLLLMLGIVIALCLFITPLSSKFRIPSLLLFIGLGMIVGLILRFTGVGNFTEYDFGNTVCSIALVFVIFYGGFGTNFKAAKPVIVHSGVLSLLGTLLTGVLTGLAVYLIFKVLPFADLTVMEAMLVGAVISSTDAASVFDILRKRKLNLKYNTASLLEVESGSNDPMSYLFTFIVVSALSFTYGMSSEEIGAGQVVALFFSQIGFGVMFGVLFGLGGAFILKKFSFFNSQGSALFIMALALLSYSIPSILPGLLAGNGYLGCYLAGIILGNSKIKAKKESVHFFDSVTQVCQMIIFFLLGLLATPEWLFAYQTFIPGLLIFIVLTLIIRPLISFGILACFKAKLNQMLLVSFGGLRGVASIVFATYAMSVLGEDMLPYDLFSMVFVIVLLSLIVQGGFLPAASRKLDMISPFENVMKTFNDYSEEKDITFVRLDISKDHAWCNKKLKDCVMPKEFLILLVLKDGKTIVPNGNTLIEENETLVCCAPCFDYDQEGLALREMDISKNSSLVGKKLAEVKFNKGELVALVKRNGNNIVPNGNTEIIENDTLVLLKVSSN